MRESCGGIEFSDLPTSQTSVPSTPCPLPLGPPTLDPLQCNLHGSSVPKTIPPGLSTHLAISPLAPLLLPSLHRAPLHQAPLGMAISPTRLQFHLGPQYPLSLGALFNHSPPPPHTDLLAQKQLLRPEREKNTCSEGHHGGTGSPKVADGKKQTRGNGQLDLEFGLTGPRGQQAKYDHAFPHL